MKPLALTLTLITLLAGGALAQVAPVPSLMNFQGRLAKLDGTPVADGTHTVVFTLFDAATGGTVKWTETQSVNARNGVFSVLLGSTTPLNETIFTADRWLEVKVDGTTLTPRQKMVSNAFAFKANLANTVPDGSLTAAKFAAGIFNPLAWLLGGNSGTNPASQFLGTTDNQPLVFRTNNTEKMRLLANGNFGIGTTNPQQKLQVGDLSVLGSQGMVRLSSNTTSNSGVSRSWDVGVPMTLENASGAGYSFVINDAGLNNAPAVAPQFMIKWGSGNVGIGTTSPAAKLDVAGTAKMTGFQLPSGAGTGKYLASDASGIGTWTVFPTSLPPSGTAGGDLSGTYPNPTVANNAITTSKLAAGAVTGDKIAGGTIGLGHLVSSLQQPLSLLSLTSDLLFNNRVFTGSSPESVAVSGSYAYVVNSSYSNTLQIFDVSNPASPTRRGSAATGNLPVSVAVSGSYAYVVNSSSNTLQVFDVSNPVSPTLNGGFGTDSNPTSVAVSGSYAYVVNSGSYTLQVFSVTELNLKIGSGLVVTGSGLFGSNVYASGVLLTSDARYKHNIATFDNALDTILNLRGVTFDWNRDAWKQRNFPEGRQVGFIAQEVEKVLPELVSTDEKGYKAVAYANVVPVLVEAMKQQQKEMEAMKAKVAEVDELKAQLATLAAELAQMKAEKAARK